MTYICTFCQIQETDTTKRTNVDTPNRKSDFFGPPVIFLRLFCWMRMIRSFSDSQLHLVDLTYLENPSCHSRDQENKQELWRRTKRLHLTAVLHEVSMLVVKLIRRSLKRKTAAMFWLQSVQACSASMFLPGVKQSQLYTSFLLSGCHQIQIQGSHSDLNENPKTIFI